MALEKVTYVDGETVIYAKNLNDIQDEVIAQNQSLTLLDSGKQDKTNYVNEPTGTSKTITAVDNTMYLFGELTELTVTAPATGIFAIRFTSGTTPTVVTLSGITMPDDWDGAEASTIYEINVLNGMGLYTSWAVSA